MGVYSKVLTNNYKFETTSIKGKSNLTLKSFKIELDTCNRVGSVLINSALHARRKPINNFLVCSASFFDFFLLFMCITIFKAKKENYNAIRRKLAFTMLFCLILMSTVFLLCSPAVSSSSQKPFTFELK